MINDPHDQLVIAYHLIIDNKRIWNEGLFIQIFVWFFSNQIEFLYLARKGEIADFFCCIKSTTHIIFINSSMLKNLS